MQKIAPRENSEAAALYQMIKARALTRTSPEQALQYGKSWEIADPERMGIRLLADLPAATLTAWPACRKAKAGDLARCDVDGLAASEVRSVQVPPAPGNKIAPVAVADIFSFDVLAMTYETDAAVRYQVPL